jgi:hypothetical protein
MMNLEEGSGELVSYLSFFWFAEICVATYWWSCSQRLTSWSLFAPLAANRLVWSVDRTDASAKWLISLVWFWGCDLNVTSLAAARLLFLLGSAAEFQQYQDRQKLLVVSLLKKCGQVNCYQSNGSQWKEKWRLTVHACGFQCLFL